MLMLILHCGEDCYACSCKEVVEVIPFVLLQKVNHMPAYVKGILNYGGRPIPVIDWNLLLVEKPSLPALHTRIVILKHTFDDGATCMLGVIAERVSQIMPFDLSQFVPTAHNLKIAPYLDGVLHTGKGTLQFVVTEKLFNFLREALFMVPSQ